MRKITIDPLTRLEGHGKIEIFLDEQGNVRNSYLQIPELRGFEKFCEGRLAEDMPQITSRICGVCPEAHHLASTKALDIAFGAQPTEPARKLRELMYCSYFIYDHILHFFYLGAPDLIVGPTAAPKDRNIFGVINKLGIETGREVIKHRSYGQKILAIIGGKATHPVCGLPGGMSKSITDQDTAKIKPMLESTLGFVQSAIEIFNKLILENREYRELISGKTYYLNTFYMGIVDEKNQMNIYDGKIRVVDPQGKECAKFDATNYNEFISERVETWTYVKTTYLKKIGRKDGMYRVGPLARLNVSEKMATPLAQEEYERLYGFFNTKPVHNTLAYHWARLVELLFVCERALQLVNDPDITSDKIRTKSGLSPSESRGIGIIEASRGTLIHDYTMSPQRTITKVNLIVPTTSNSAAINKSINETANHLIKNGSVSEGILNMIEMAYRAYDPCFACSTHSFPGGLPLVLNIYDSNRRLVKKIV